MFSPKVKLGLLVGTHIVCGMVFALPSPISGDLALIRLLVLVCADAGLVGLWGGLGSTRLAGRLPAVVIATVYLAMLLLAIPSFVKVSFCLVVASITLAILVVLGGLRYSRLRLRLANLADESLVSQRFQFSIRHLLVATAIVAVVLGMGRIAWGDGGQDSFAFVIVAVFCPCCIVVQLAILWATLGMGRPVLRLAIVLPTAFITGAIPASYLHVPSRVGIAPYLIWSALVGLQAIITAASLLVVRSCGWRLVWGDSGRAGQQVLLDHQGPATVPA